MQYVAVAFGGALGAILRFSISAILQGSVPGVFPLATLFVNLSGSFLIGLMWGVSESFPLSNTARLFLFTGVLGAYTTFSTFALENISLLREGRFDLAFANILISNLAGLFLAFLGFYLSRSLLPQLLAR